MNRNRIGYRLPCKLLPFCLVAIFSLFFSFCSCRSLPKMRNIGISLAADKDDLVICFYTAHDDILISFDDIAIYDKQNNPIHLVVDWGDSPARFFRLENIKTSPLANSLTLPLPDEMKKEGTFRMVFFDISRNKYEFTVKRQNNDFTVKKEKYSYTVKRLGSQK